MSDKVEKTEEEDSREEKRGVGVVAREAILAGMTNDEVLEKIKEELPDSNAKVASVNWYRNELRQQEGSTVKTSREITKERREAEEAANPKPKKDKKGKVEEETVEDDPLA